MNFTSTAWKQAPKAILDSCTVAHVIKGFVAADDYATNAARSIGSVAIAAVDFTYEDDTVADSDGVGHKITFAGKTAPRTGTSLVTDDLSVVFGTATDFHFANNVTGIEITTDAPNIVIPAFSHHIRNPS